MKPVRYSSTSTNSIQDHSSTIERNCIPNFGQYKSQDEADINLMIRTSRPYSHKEFNQIQHSKTEINNSCEFVPTSNMIRYDDLLHGIPLYIDRNVQLTNLMIDRSKQFAWVLSGLANQVFQLPIQAIHLFRDVDSGKDIKWGTKV